MWYNGCGGSYTGLIDLQNGEMIEGDLSAKAYNHVKKWFDLHKDELYINGRRSRLLGRVIYQKS